MKYISSNAAYLLTMRLRWKSPTNFIFWNFDNVWQAFCSYSGLDSAFFTELFGYGILMNSSCIVLAFFAALQHPSCLVLQMDEGEEIEFAGMLRVPAL